MSIYDALTARRDALVGYRAPARDVERLEAAVAGHDVAPLMRVYRELNVCYMGLEFVIEDGVALAPGPDFGQVDDDWVIEREHRFYWHPPRFILRELASYPASQAALRAGYLPIGGGARGGDTYFVRIDEIAQSRQSLWQIYAPGTNAESTPPVPEDALTLVCDFLAEVIRVASFDKPRY